VLIKEFKKELDYEAFLTAYLNAKNQMDMLHVSAPAHFAQS
jgi:hypothetical protein